MKHLSRKDICTTIDPYALISLLFYLKHISNLCVSVYCLWIQRFWDIIESIFYARAHRYIHFKSFFSKNKKKEIRHGKCLRAHVSHHQRFIKCHSCKICNYKEDVTLTSMFQSAKCLREIKRSFIKFIWNMYILHFSLFLPWFSTLHSICLFRVICSFNHRADYTHMIELLCGTIFFSFCYLLLLV